MIVRRGGMDKPMLVFKRFGHQIHLMVQRRPSVVALNLWVDHKVRLYVLDSREENQNLVLIKDIEQGTQYYQVCGSNLVKRMVQNGLVELEASPVDKEGQVCSSDGQIAFSNEAG